MRNLFFCALLLLALGASSCDSSLMVDDKPKPTVQYLVFGVYAGECYWLCAPMFKVNDSVVYYDSTDTFKKNKWRRVEFPAEPMAPSRYRIAQRLLPLLPQELLDTHSTVYGVPDAYDQGGYYIEFKQDTVKQFWIDTFDDAIPEFARVFTDSVTAIMYSLWND